MSFFPKEVAFAHKKLGNLVDGSKTSIFEHGLRVGCKLKLVLDKSSISAQKKQAIIIAGLFHDLLEDTDATEKEIVQLTNKDVLRLVKEMTIDFKDKTIKEAIAPLYFVSEECSIIKLVDILDNTSKSIFVVSANGIGWYRDFYIPLLQEYSLLIGYWEKNSKVYKIFFTELANEVEVKINELQNFLQIYSKHSA
ncbi:hypothetical protein COU89_00370 [Candidatus Roizmanbacteria bacterium CG10_big_fil_rev_8_21_14_0_10_45_7]|uniref:HD/PDEase domain-containing protein n=1 Tax=Candidatus Roizmanbacteria bacterium CG10_big_fil_rev_8_21_14_0_10_45_7 TaxID=1974854 RepID=A0A2M8KVQ2_9BACT|nr:MAG: hypothetical protein COU89_00370 [Candidatus Roizmanbacteria bacterium CG10_big_fil_rev_8_21_14_0_10_45_7]